MIPPTLYFFIALHIVVLIRSLMLKGDGIPSTVSVSIAIASVVLGKSVLIADLLPFINRYPQKPLIYNITWKTCIYFIVSMLLHYIEVIVELWHRDGSFSVGMEDMYSRIVWPHFWALQILLAVLILMYCTMRELIRVIGPKQVWQIFFGKIPPFMLKN